MLDWIRGVLVLLALGAGPARADLIVDFSGGATGGVTPVEYYWQRYQYAFVATSTSTQLTFLIRNDPGFMGLDTISVSQRGSSTNLLVNGGLEVGPDAASGLAPAGWQAVGETGLAYAGYWQTGTAGPAYWQPQSGVGFWYDGAVGGHDGIMQAIATTVGATYDLAFWMASYPVANGTTVDYQVFAGAQPSTVTVVTGGSVAVRTDVAEPASVVAMAVWLIGLVAVRFRGRRFAGRATA